MALGLILALAFSTYGYVLRTWIDSTLPL